MELKENVVVADRFRLVRMIGRGGMGSVWEAVHITLDQPCAVKFIEGELGNVAEAHARFEREAKAAAQLRSPHVVQILDHGVWQGRPYIAMELLEGEDLGKALARSGGRLPPAQVNAIVQQVCRALTKAHQAGIVHRDLKPDNIFLVNDDDRLLVKILDFGVAKQTSQALDGSNTKTGAMIGTPYYMSPEQAQGIKTVDSRSDLWSLAVIVYECITGKLPFQSEALGDLLVKIIVNPIPVPSQVADVPPGFDQWWAKAAERAPEKRFQTAKEFASALSIALGFPNVTDEISAVRPAPLQGTAVMSGAPTPSTSGSPPTTSAPYPQRTVLTPHPNQGQPGRPSSPGFAAAPTPDPARPADAVPTATFSGVEPPMTVPKKGLPIGVIAGIGGFVVLAAVGVGLVAVSNRSSGTATATSSVASSAPAPTSSDSPSGPETAGVASAAPTAADTAGSAGDTSEGVADTSGADAADASAGTSASAESPSQAKPTTTATGRVGRPTPPVPTTKPTTKPTATATATAKKPWNPGF